MTQRLSVLLLCLFAAAGCGQTGPLYLPDGDNTAPVVPDEADETDERDADDSG